MVVVLSDYAMTVVKKAAFQTNNQIDINKEIFTIKLSICVDSCFYSTLIKYNSFKQPY
ncbi:hypothetical protein l11_19650 [Neisseria weaveri LMG 5135]|nr:hypothetical protein l13_19420 [Neisseria weaveri ATCC 51223]EGV35815.1 hypothetical protein l11_19650 [Neisseria weaveri LMG 5135]